MNSLVNYWKLSSAVANTLLLSHRVSSLRALPKLTQISNFRRFSNKSFPPTFTKSPKVVPPPPDDTSVKKLYSRMQSLEDSMRFHGFSLLRVFIGVLVLIGLALFIFYEEVQEFLGREGAKVAGRSISDETVQVRAEQLAKGVVAELLNDQKTQETALLFLRSLFQQEETKILLVALLGGVLQDEKTLLQAQRLANQVAVNLLKDDETMRTLTALFVRVLHQEDTRAAAAVLVHNLFNDESVRQHAIQFFQNVLGSIEITSRASELAQRATDDVLKDQKIREDAKNFVESIIKDEQVQKMAGEAVWAAVKMTVIPGFLSKNSPQMESSKGASNATPALARAEETK